jgi:phytoene dehydrogenase-like protein
MRDADVIVVGGGLTGLRAAYELERGGAAVLVIEGNDTVGGRVRSTHVDGFILDHGFQVILSGYPELKSIQGIDSLNLATFLSGARIQTNAGCVDLLDWRSGFAGIKSLLKAPFLSYTDLLRLGVFSLLSPTKAPHQTGISTAEDLRTVGFSESAVQSFLRPFLGGVLVDSSLALDSGAARFYMGMFTRGHAALPRNGMQALPDLLASAIGRSHILLSSRVSKVSEHEVVLASGETLSARHVLCAVDGLAAVELGAEPKTMPYGTCATVYFAADRPPYTEPILFLNGTGRGVVNHVAVVSNVQPSYAPHGRALISVTVVGGCATRATVVEDIRGELTQWFGAEAHRWEHLKSFVIPGAVPLRPRFSDGWCSINGVFYAGDYLSYGSQNGALAAGRSVARSILELLFTAV